MTRTQIQELTTKPFLTFSDVQSYLGIKSRKTLLKYIKQGYLPAYKLGGTRWRFLPEDIDTFLRSQQRPAGSGKRNRVNSRQQKNPGGS